MTDPISFGGEVRSNAIRETIANREPKALRTFTPSQAVLAHSAGSLHWTPEGRRLYDYTSGVLVANLGHNPRRWQARLAEEMGWKADAHAAGNGDGNGYFEATTLSAYNAITPVEARAVDALLGSLRATPSGERFEVICWAASGSEAIQKALWACLGRDPQRQRILATRHGFHGKKGLAGAVTGSEADPERDPRVSFIDFPTEEILDIEEDFEEIDLAPYRQALEAAWAEHGEQIGCLITEPYLGGGGSFHPPKAYLQLLEQFCREHDILFVLDEVQSNFGRTGSMYAFEKYEIAPDFVCLGKGMANGIPVAAVAGRSDVFSLMNYGAASDTWSANPIACAGVIATLDEFERGRVLEHAATIAPIMREGLLRLKETGLIAHVRGEGMVYGVECAPAGDSTAREVADAIVEASYLGEPGGDGIHIMGPLSRNVIRISPPLTITAEQAQESLELLFRIVTAQAERHGALAASA